MRLSSLERMLVGTLGAIFILLGMASCPRDPHPERTPSPAPSSERGLQTGRQPAPEPTCYWSTTMVGKVPTPILICD